MDQYYRIAGLTVKMDACGRTADLALPYRIDPVPEADFAVEANLQPLKAAYPNAREETLEYLAAGRDFYTKLIDFSGMMLHASAISMDGKAYLFSADSGIGKSTHTSLWRRVFGDERVRIINDDKPALRLMDGTWYACGTPWSGKYGLNLNLHRPLAGICFLEQGPSNTIEPYRGNDIIFRLLRQTFRPSDLEHNDKLLTLIGSLLEKVPMWRLECNTEPEAAQIAWAAMSGRTPGGN